MKRQSRDESCAIEQRNARGARRLLAVGLSIIAALLLVLTIAVRPVAFAAERVGSDTMGGAQSVNDLMMGQVADNGSATVLVYLNGSDLESQAGEATSDIAEMLESGIGSNANVVIETLGTSKWQNFGIASDHTQRYIVNQGKLQLVDDSLGQLDTTDPDTLADFISWGVQNYPADRYILLMWDHGAGPVYGFGYDEFQSENSALTLDEMKQALDANPDVHFDIIGMDCCIMGSLETCVALQPYCDYTVLSEDFEPGVGWSYQGWMSMLEQNPRVDTEKLGTVIVDDMIADVAKDKDNGDATLALIDESQIDELYDAWTGFAYANEDALVGTNYSHETEWRDRPETDLHFEIRGPGHSSLYDELFGSGNGGAHDGSGFGYDDGYSGHGGYGFGYDGGYDSYDSYDMGYDDLFGWSDSNEYYNGYDAYGWDIFWQGWDYDGSYVTMTDYYVTDIMEVASSIGGTEATALKTAFENAMVHYGSTSGEASMSGMGVTLPYADAEFYDQLVDVFTACGIDDHYVEWLGSFV